MNGVDPTGLSGGGFPDPFDDSPSQDKYYTSNLVGRGSGIPAANAFFRSVSAWIPGVGPLLGFHEALTGCDVTGTPVSGLDHVLGTVPLIPLIGGVVGKAVGGIGEDRKSAEGRALLAIAAKHTSNPALKEKYSFWAGTPLPGKVFVLGRGKDGKDFVREVPRKSEPKQQ